ncbi:metallophosphoesterase family protein [Paramaledivibacter caminithermalis]|jgi:predicted phosphodiesterase|uniref:Calcineurin-like phosphoesterase n=1 Tax=Paramaledivibacter caminithermalis (strain DSM 15212 / CIP 107654 / DViRD3) TaxID=1121301 RepID=A0A1M6MHL9_PARC5|nr:metallophosphoesterase family protein [Paramaledivibacter caminithermalis]SHJ82972.1 Calcineurin-like phosphoesterase [Paramaledivibacter caminithermalis DSM 15212]
MENFKGLLYYLFGRVYITKNIRLCNEDLLLHISDTPSSFYPGLRLLLKDLRPKYIIHTGDLVDNIKLQLYPNKIDIYKKKIKVLIKILENSFADEIYLVLGNHDDYSAVKTFTKKSIILKEGKIITIDNDIYNISHFSNSIIEAPAEYNLYGHDTALHSKIENKKVYLNGIEGINIIALSSKKIFVLPYPHGTNDDRMCKSNVGI